MQNLLSLFFACMMMLPLWCCSQKTTQPTQQATQVTKQQGKIISNQQQSNAPAPVKTFKPRGQQETRPAPKPIVAPPKQTKLQVGAARLDQYIHLLQGKNVGMVVNQTSTIGDTHLVDFLLANGVQVKKVFAPEHGFRGKADAGEKVKDSRDVKTGLPILSLYGKNKKPNGEQLVGINVLVFDIQDVGARFYTYISTMHYIMEAGAENNIPVIVLDRPNPNGHYVDGPVLESAFKSFVGMHPIPIVHGLTVGELAKMINGEGWLQGGALCDLTVVTCTGYNHNNAYVLPVKPSPNLPNNRAIYLYPSLCLFEGTNISIGRGTDRQFQVVGSPYHDYRTAFFTPAPNEGAKNPKHNGKVCRGIDFSTMPTEQFRQARKFDLQWLLKFYHDAPDKEAFFSNSKFFDKLAGTSQLRQQIKQNFSQTRIEESWQAGLMQYKQIRKKYLLYSDFE